MTLFQDTGGDPRATAARLADVLAWYGAAGDAACGNAPGLALRKASVGASLAQSFGVEASELHACAYAGLLHAIGAIGNAAFCKGERLSERLAKIEAWDVPAQGARICSGIAALPLPTADIVRWQSEFWDGTGYPDRLRWHGIPRVAQALHLADTYVHAADPEDTLAEVYLQSGRRFGPDAARTFTAWFRLHGGEAPELALNLEALTPKPGEELSLLDVIADRVDAHNGVPDRWQRVRGIAEAIAANLGMDEAEGAALALATRLFGAGELSASEVEDAQFDPLSRMGIEERAKNASAAASQLDGNASLGHAAAVLRARAEWYDGTGKPSGSKHEQIPLASRVLAIAIAFDTLKTGRFATSSGRSSPTQRIDTAAGTQFDPTVVRALLAATKVHA